MRAVDINNYQDLERYIKLELAQQTTTRVKAEIELPALWFTKLIKFLRYYMRNDTREKEIQQELPKDLKKFYIEINKVRTTIIRT